MLREFISTATFDKLWYDLSLSDDDLQELQNYLMENPIAGKLIVGTGGLRKVRWTLPNKGKSGGIRVLYVDYLSYEKTILINCYSKNEQDNISDSEKAMYKSLIKAIEKDYGRNS
ncbi:MAG: type II toxin-antitoxin system RelE/ParE family toxin [Oscillospiraceae bacterium]|nr:type II toxin-antitoxin system RelE/ParE family toxin [Oscillospiraceae bacterium]